MEILNAIEIYEEYFEKKKEVISKILKYYKSKSMRIAIWGAGLRGKAFLKVFDIECTIVDYVYDINEKRFGERLETGHLICDYRENKSDIVLVMNNLHEVDIYDRLTEVYDDIELLNIDNIILGDLHEKDIIEQSDVVIDKVRDIRIAAVTVVYNPTGEIYENILYNSNFVPKMYVYDNSEKIDKDLVNKIKSIQNVVYISYQKNNGIGKAINDVAKCLDEKVEWLFTFDQDSKCKDDMMYKMIEFAESSLCTSEIGIIVPNIMGKKDRKHPSYYTYFDKAFQSGMMINIKVLNELNGFDEYLMVDYTDYEYCVRMRLAGYKIVKINNANLMHNLQDEQVKEKYIDGKKILINKYSDMRYFYIKRNNEYLFEKYKHKDKIYALQCVNDLEKIKMNECYEKIENIEQNIIEEKLLENERLYNIFKAKYDLMVGMENEISIKNKMSKMNLGVFYIYGKGELGIKFEKIIRNQKIDGFIGYIEKNRSLDLGDVRVYSLENEYNKLDKDAVIVISAIDFFNDIIKDIRDKGIENRIISLSRCIN